MVADAIPKALPKILRLTFNRRESIHIMYTHHVKYQLVGMSKLVLCNDKHNIMKYRCQLESLGDR
jgi:hypothetical protein